MCEYEGKKIGLSKRVYSFIRDLRVVSNHYKNKVTNSLLDDHFCKALAHMGELLA